MVSRICWLLLLPRLAHAAFGNGVLDRKRIVELPDPSLPGVKYSEHLVPQLDRTKGLSGIERDRGLLFDGRGEVADILDDIAREK